MTSARHLNLPTADEVRELLDYDPDTGFFTWRTRGSEWFVSESVCAGWNSRFAGKRAGSLSNAGYVIVVINATNYKAHRLAFVWVTGAWPAEEIDHKDHCRNNNAWANLRAVSRAGNNRNRSLQHDNASGVAGVYREQGKWRALIGANGRQKHLGMFTNFDDAVSARRAAEISLGYHENHGTSE